jgi:hypothetical protein
MVEFTTKNQDRGFISTALRKSKNAEEMQDLGDRLKRVCERFMVREISMHTLLGAQYLIRRLRSYARRLLFLPSSTPKRAMKFRMHVMWSLSRASRRPWPASR